MAGTPAKRTASKSLSDILNGEETKKDTNSETTETPGTLETPETVTTPATQISDSGGHDNSNSENTSSEPTRPLITDNTRYDNSGNGVTDNLPNDWDANYPSGTVTSQIPSENASTTRVVQETVYATLAEFDDKGRNVPEANRNDDEFDRDEDYRDTEEDFSLIDENGNLKQSSERTEE